MASFLRGKQAGIEGDLSAGITGDIFAIDDVSILNILLLGFSTLEQTASTTTHISIVAC